ncbi:MAG: hypothetical protein HY701_12175 [Gemmatimonadetes bacterium]|nr:hypothetical protein [Gemmatimonadota bacterium]
MKAREPKLYLAFPDGVLHYVCAECTALCCRGQGIGGSLKREMGHLLKLYPLLGTLAVRRRGNIVEFTNPTSGCQFLQSDLRCAIEVKHGKAYKPGVCVLFPFNRLGRIGRTVTIRPHFLCPLRLVVPARPGEVEGTHERVIEAVRETALVDESFHDRVPAFRLHPSERAGSVVAREECFRQACADGIGSRTFQQTLQSQLDEPSMLEAFVRRALALLGANAVLGSDEADPIDHVFHALAPALRLDMLHLGEPAILKALALGEAMVRSSLRLVSRIPTPQTVQSLLESISPALRLLARDTEPLRLPSVKRVKIPAFGDPAMTFAMFTAHRRAERGTPVLEALEQSVKPEMSAADRSVLLFELGMRAEAMRPQRKKG